MCTFFENNNKRYKEREIRMSEREKNANEGRASHKANCSFKFQGVSILMVICWRIIVHANLI